MSVSPDRIESVDSYQIIQVSGRFDIIGPDKEVLVSFNLKDKEVDFRRNLKFFNDANELFAQLAQNTTNNEVLDIFSNLGIDIKAPTFRIDYFDPHLGKLVGIGPDGLLIAVEPNAGQDVNTTTPQAIPMNSETDLTPTITTSGIKTNPKLFVQLVVDNANNYMITPRVYVGGVLAHRMEDHSNLLNTPTTISFEVVLTGVIPDSTEVKVSVESNKACDVNSLWMKLSDNA